MMEYNNNDENKTIKDDLSNLKDTVQEYTLDILENVQRKFMEMNWFPSQQDAFTNQRVSFHMEQFKRKNGSDKEFLDTVFLTSFGVFGIYLLYKMMEKTNAV